MSLDTTFLNSLEYFWVFQICLFRTLRYICLLHIFWNAEILRRFIFCQIIGEIKWIKYQCLNQCRLFLHSNYQWIFRNPHLHLCTSVQPWPYYNCWYSLKHCCWLSFSSLSPNIKSNESIRFVIHSIRVSFLLWYNKTF